MRVKPENLLYAALQLEVEEDAIAASLGVSELLREAATEIVELREAAGEITGLREAVDEIVELQARMATASQALNGLRGRMAAVSARARAR